MNSIKSQKNAVADPANSEDVREAYHPPELKNLGSVAELTNSTFNGEGADGGYS